MQFPTSVLCREGFCIKALCWICVCSIVLSMFVLSRNPKHFYIFWAPSTYPPIANLRRSHPLHHHTTPLPSIAHHRIAPHPTVTHPIAPHPIIQHPVSHHPISPHPVSPHPISTHPISPHPIAGRQVAGGLSGSSGRTQMVRMAQVAAGGILLRTR